MEKENVKKRTKKLKRELTEVQQPIKKEKIEVARKSGKKYSVDALLAKAEECIDTFNYELAQKFCQRALQIDQDNVKGLEVAGQLFLETKDFENAKKYFDHAITISPDSGHVKYMYMGQLLQGTEAITHYKKGIEIMLSKQTQQVQKAVETANNFDKQDVITARDLSSAYLNIAEIYTTDLCDTEEAESKCRENIDKALEADPENPEVHQQLASFYLIKEQPEMALESLQKSLSFWLPKMRLAFNSHEEYPEDSDPTEICPLSYQVRITTCQLLIELEDYKTAVEILEMLLEEDDEVIQVWYLLGWTSILIGVDYKSNARFYLSKAKKLSSKIVCDDENLLSHIDELLQDLGPDNGDESDDNSDLNENELETASDDDEDMEN